MMGVKQRKVYEGAGGEKLNGHAGQVDTRHKTTLTYLSVDIGLIYSITLTSRWMEDGGLTEASIRGNKWGKTEWTCRSG